MNVKEILLPFDARTLPQQQLNAGELTCLYETGKIRKIIYKTTEIIRMIYPALRDENWTTIDPVITHEKINQGKDFFKISYTATYTSGSINYKASIEIEGTNENRIRFSMNGKALSAFKKNRIGLCVHHPIFLYAGNEVLITHTQGNEERNFFPVLISPHQPFKDIKEMKWDLLNTGTCMLQFSGDVFETEDQRNWSDSSFKTYSTPLDIPFPAQVAIGDTIKQEINFSCSVVDSSSTEPTPEPSEEMKKFPYTGYNRVSELALLSEKERDLSSQVLFDYYRVTIDTGIEGWQDQLAAAVEDAKEMGILLELVVIFDSNNQMIANDFLAFIEGTKQVAKILPLEKSKNLTTPELFEENMYQGKKVSPQTEIGYGCSGNFADLNRNRPVGLAFDFLSFSIHPQVHSSDTFSILENLENQVDCLQTAQSFSDGKPVDIQLQFAMKDDTRQKSYFMALWILLSVQNLAEAGLIILEDLTGKSGIISDSSEPTPLYTLLAELYDFNPTHIIRQFQGNKLLNDQFCVENGREERLLIRFVNSPGSGSSLAGKP